MSVPLAHLLCVKPIVVLTRSVFDPDRLLWFPIIFGFCALSILIIRGNVLELHELDSVLNHVDGGTEGSPNGKRGGGSKGGGPKAETGKAAAEVRPKTAREVQQILKSQFADVFAGRAVNSSSLDKFSERLFRREVRRMETELKNEMQRETWKIKQKSGKIKKLKIQRPFEPEELEYYKERRSKDARRALGVFSSSAFSCMVAAGCKAAMNFQITKDVALDSDDFREPYLEPCIKEESVNGTNTTIAAPAEDCNLAPVTIPEYRDCSVVGNSGVMKHSMKGSVINRSNAVFRINQAPTAGHVADVGLAFTGEKATFRVLNNAWAQIYAGIFHNHRHYDFKKLPLEQNCTLILTRSTPHTFASLRENLRKHDRGDVRVYQLSQNMMQRAREVMLNYRMLSDRIAEMEHRWKQNQVKGGTTPSTGFVGIMLAKRLCTGVNVYGLSKEASRDASSSSWSYHYFQQSHKNIDLPVAELRAHPHHSFRLEGIILNHFMEVGVVALEEAPGGESGSPVIDWTGGKAGGSSDHSAGCPITRPPPGSDCDGGASETKSQETKAPEAAKEGGKVGDSGAKPAEKSGETRSARHRDRGTKRGPSPGGSAQASPHKKAAARSAEKEAPGGKAGDGGNATKPASGRAGGRRGRVKQSTQIIRKRNRDRAKMAQAKDAEDTKALQELEEILRAQQEQNERVSKIKKPHNSKHVPLDKIEDPEERKREEIWRAEEAKMSGAQIDESA